MPEHNEEQSFPDEPPFKESSSSFGVFYPKNYLLAVFADEATARRAGDGLRAAGFSEDGVIVASGADVVAYEQEVEEDQGVFAKIGEQLSKLYTDESAASQALVKLAAGGAGFVLVHAPEEEETTTATTVLAGFKPLVMRKYGTLAIAELPV